MREGRVSVRCSVAPARLWELRANVDLDRRIAERERRTVEQVGKDRNVEDEHGRDLVERVLVVKVPDDFVPKFFQQWVTAGQLHTRVTARWRSDAHDADNPCVVNIVLPALADRVEMGYRQWLEPEAGGEGCAIVSITRIGISNTDMPKWVAGAIEAIVQGSMHSALKQYPTHVDDYLRSAESVAQPLEGAPRPRRARVPSEEDACAGAGAGAAGGAGRGSRCFCQCELWGILRVVCGRGATTTPRRVPIDVG